LRPGTKYEYRLTRTANGTAYHYDSSGSQGGTNYSTFTTESLVFDGTFPASGLPDTTNIWTGVCACNPTSATIAGVPDPLGSGQNVGKWTVTPSQFRSDLQGPPDMSPTEHNDVYISIPVYLPTSEISLLPDPQGFNGFMINEQYGPPHNGSPTNAISAVNRSGQLHYEFSTSDAVRTYSMWQSPAITTDHWHTVIEHIHWAADNTHGFVELWYDGQRQQFSNWQGFSGAPVPTNGAYRLPIVTDGTCCNQGPNYVNINLYGNHTTSTLVLYHGEVRVSQTLAGAQPAVTPYGP
jgi:Polysaccharide lyase